VFVISPTFEILFVFGTSYLTRN